MFSFIEYLEEANHSTGTYASLLPDQSSTAYLNTLCEMLGITDVPDFHCTLVYSRVPVPELEELPVPFPVHASIDKYDIFPSKEGKKVLVLRLKSETLHALFDKTMLMGCTYDFDAYKPHITLSYDYTGATLNGDFSNRNITFDRIDVQGLDL